MQSRRLKSVVGSYWFAHRGPRETAKLSDRWSRAACMRKPAGTCWVCKHNRWVVWGWRRGGARQVSAMQVEWADMDDQMNWSYPLLCKLCEICLNFFFRCLATHRAKTWCQGYGLDSGASRSEVCPSLVRLSDVSIDESRCSRAGRSVCGPSWRINGICGIF